MARSRPLPPADADAWRRLNWDDFSAAFDDNSVERGRAYQRQGRVQRLARTADGAVIAWVQGTERYATEARLTPDDAGRKLTSRCSCPVGHRCKHGVAVAVQYLEALKAGTPVPAAAADDPRLRQIEDADLPPEDEFGDEFGEDEDDDGEDWDNEGEEYDDEDEENDEPPARRRSAPRETPTRARWSDQGREKPSDAALREYLASRSADDLVRYVLELAGRFPEVKADLAERSDLASGDVMRLVRQTRQQIRKVTAGDAWVNGWSGEGELPDYSGIQRRFEQLLGLGAFDELLSLGRELFEQGNEQVGRSHDEGETATGIQECMAVVMRAVPRSSRPGPEKLLYVVDVCLADEYDLVPDVEAVLDAGAVADWSAVADELAARLAREPKPRGDEFIDRFQRDQLTHWLADALARAGRHDEVMALYEAEARITGSYVRLVQALLERGRLDDADRWAKEGIERTAAKWPGIAKQLQDELRQIAERRKDWPLVAAYRAEDFFEQPHVGAFRDLVKAAEKAGHGDAVRAAALKFLETGERPAAAKGKKPGWPLPKPVALPGERRFQPERGPRYDVLLQMALAEKKPDEILHWYDKMAAQKKDRFGGWHPGGAYAERVADAVAATHPDRALPVYKSMAEQLINQASPSAYLQARGPLRKLRDLLRRLGRPGEWDAYLVQLRDTHRRKRRFLEVLDGLEGRPIVDE